MILIKLIHWIFGYVKFKGTTENFEMFLDMASKQGINIWELKIEGKKLSGSIYKNQYKLLRPIAYASSTKIRIDKKIGVPFFIEKSKKRKGILIGIPVFLIFIYIMSQFIWVVTINPTKDIDEDKTIDILSEQGLYSGVKRKSLDTQTIERKIMLNDDDVAWISINITGSVAEVEMSIKTQQPEMKEIDREDTSCLIASKEAQVTRNEVYSGTVMVPNGEVVQKGEVLVTPTMESESGEIIQTGASGKVFAMTREEMSINIPYDQTVQTATDKQIKRRQLNFFGIKIPLSLTAIPDGITTVSTQKNNVKLLGGTLPISITEETYTQYNEEKVSLTQDEAYEKAEETLQKKLESKTNENEATIIQCDETVETNSDSLILNASVLCEENIAVKN